MSPKTFLSLLALLLLATHAFAQDVIHGRCVGVHDGDTIQVFAPGGRNRYTLTVDVIEHRSFFTLGNWNASTRIKWRVQQANGSVLREGVSVGEGHRSNMAGYLTARAVSQDAFDVAMADLMSSLSAIPTSCSGETFERFAAATIWIIPRRAPD